LFSKMCRGFWRRWDRLTRTVTEPHLPLSFVGMECGSPRLVPQ
jgi:hypothetical protein